MSIKLSVLLARADHSSKQFSALLSDYLVTFKTKQGIFRGIKKQYTPETGQEDQPSLSGNIEVQSTVKDYLQWFVDTVEEFVNHRFSIEATNATGPKAELKAEEMSFGLYSTAELLRLADFLNSPELNKMYQELPVRSDTASWRPSLDKDLAKKGIHETEPRELQNKTTIKGSRILLDPNLVNLKGNQNYIPQVVPDDQSVLLGKQKIQDFTGEISHRERAEILRRLTSLKAAVKEALTIANDAPAVESAMTAKKLFGYLHTGKF
jgi:hypothetical protein